MTTPAERVRRLVERLGEAQNRDVVRALRVSPATAHRLFRALTTGGILERRGQGRAARYRLRSLRRRFRLAGLDEHRAWEAVAAEIARIRPLEADAARSLAYAASEMLNNAADHSGGKSVEVAVRFERAGATVATVRDDGIGVYRRISEDFGYTMPQDAIVQLEKGKLTSDPARHSGEGLFFSSKAVTRFRLESQETAWIVDNQVRDSAIAPSEVRRGTRVELVVIPGHVPRLESVFAAFTDPETLRFTRTRATIKLAGLGKTLVSRSEAKRLVARLTDFRHAILDFSGVQVVGQGFCDEVFRVFAHAHPHVTLEPVGMNDTVAFMVNRARAVATS
ncbi:MAG: STAS-like domain-containing protein [Candidatus Binatia bacterium]